MFFYAHNRKIKNGCWVNISVLLLKLQVVFRTRIYHCNISTQGYVNLDMLKDIGWSPTSTVYTLLSAIYHLLTSCDPYSSLVSSISDQFLKNREEHDRIAKMWTWKFATWYFSSWNKMWTWKFATWYFKSSCNILNQFKE